MWKVLFQVCVYLVCTMAVCSAAVYSIVPENIAQVQEPIEYQYQDLDGAESAHGGYGGYGGKVIKDWSDTK